MSRLFGPAPLVRAIVLATTSFLGVPCLPAAPAAASDCLAAPDNTPTAGRHWFYRLDRGTDRKCWYLREAGEPRRATPEASETAPAPAAPLAAAASAEPPARPLTASERDVLFQEFLAWRLQQPSEETTGADAAR